MRITRLGWKVPWAIVAIAIVAAACGTDRTGSESSRSSSASSRVAGSPVVAASTWERIVPGGDCQCADGSEFSFFERRADPTKVVFFLDGGGACFDAETCAFT